MRRKSKRSKKAKETEKNSPTDKTLEVKTKKINNPVLEGKDIAELICVNEKEEPITPKESLLEKNGKETSTKNTPIKRGKRSRRPNKTIAICVGINDYPGTFNDLRGCVNDANEWATLLRRLYRFNDVSIFTDSNATVRNVKRSLEKAILNASRGDKIVFTFSGHGTTVPDLDGDEKNGFDEALCCYDGLIIDDEIRHLIRRMADGVSLSVIADCCHSGTITRAFLQSQYETIKNKKEINEPKPKYMPMNQNISAMSVEAPVAKNRFLCESNMKEILLTGSKDTEYSFDARMGGRFMGAMTYHATRILRRHRVITWKRLHEEIRRHLPSRQLPQTPQLEGTEENKNKIVFD